MQSPGLKIIIAVLFLLGFSIHTADAGSSFSINHLDIPNKFGSITEIHEGDKPTIFLVVSLPTYNAQKDTAAILEYLIQKYGLYLVLVEGGSRNDSLKHLRTMGTPEKRFQVAEDFLRQGKIQGENYLDIVSNYDFLVYGVDDPDLYNASVAGDWAAWAKRPTAMIGNSLKQIEEKQVAFAALIAIKEIIPALCGLLRENGIAYVVVLPSHATYTKEDLNQSRKLLDGTFIPMKKEE